MSCPTSPGQRCSWADSRGDLLLCSGSCSRCLPLRPHRSRIQWPWQGQADRGLAAEREAILSALQRHQQKTLIGSRQNTAARILPGRTLGNAAMGWRPTRALEREMSPAEKALPLGLPRSWVGTEWHRQQTGWGECWIRGE